MIPSHSKNRKRLFLFASAVGAIIASFIVFEHSFYQMRSPLGSGVGRIVYKKTKTFGYGPGGNETGIIIFKLSQKSIKALKAKPEAFLASLPKTTKKCRYYKNWRETPLVAKETNISGTVAGEPFTLDAFLNRYGFGISLPDKYRSIIDTAFSQDNSFVGTACGSFVFIPDEEIAAYIFVG